MHVLIKVKSLHLSSFFFHSAHRINGTAFLRLTMDDLNSNLGIKAWGVRSNILELVTKAQQQQEEEHEDQDEVMPRDVG